jgi:hypothetical protein
LPVRPNSRARIYRKDIFRHTRSCKKSKSFDVIAHDQRHIISDVIVQCSKSKIIDEIAHAWYPTYSLFDRWLWIILFFSVLAHARCPIHTALSSWAIEIQWFPDVITHTRSPMNLRVHEIHWISQSDRSYLESSEECEIPVRDNLARTCNTRQFDENEGILSVVHYQDEITVVQCNWSDAEKMERYNQSEKDVTVHCIRLMSEWNSSA